MVQHEERLARGLSAEQDALSSACGDNYNMYGMYLKANAGVERCRDVESSCASVLLHSMSPAE